MNKKLAIAIVVIICIVAVLFVTGRNSDESQEPQTTVSSVDSTKETKKDESGKTQEKATKTTTENSGFTPDEIEKKDPDEIVEFEIPVLFLDAEYQNNLNKLIRDKGYESAEYTWNKKNVKITLRALSYDFYDKKKCTILIY